jgi:RHS repeat-associated protein
MLKHPAPGSFVVTYTVDQEGRLTHIRVGNRVIARFQYRLPTQPRRRIQGPLTSEYEHDDNGVLKAVTVSGFASGNDLRFDLVRDNGGRLETCTRTHGPVRVVWGWEYDEPGRIKTESRSTDNAGAIEQVTTTRLFDGDDVLRREQVQVSDGTTILSDDTVERSREERGRILSETNAPPLKYDNNGSLVQFGSTEYEYDAWQRLIRVLLSGQTVAEYEYDALHRLARRRTPEDVEDYIYDGWHLIEVRRDGEPIERYVYSEETDDLVFAEIGTESYHVLSNPMGRTHAIVDAQGRVAQFYRYSLRGRFDVLDSNYNVVTQAPAIRLLFQRRVWDSVAGLLYFRARWYLPELGIFLTGDPSGYLEGTEHYGLNHGDPVNFSDPFGLQDQHFPSTDDELPWIWMRKSLERDLAGLPKTGIPKAGRAKFKTKKGKYDLLNDSKIKLKFMGGLNTKPSNFDDGHGYLLTSVSFEQELMKPISLKANIYFGMTGPDIGPRRVQKSLHKAIDSTKVTIGKAKSKNVPVAGLGLDLTIRVPFLKNSKNTSGYWWIKGGGTAGNYELEVHLKSGLVLRSEKRGKPTIIVGAGVTNQYETQVRDNLKPIVYSLTIGARGTSNLLGLFPNFPLGVDTKDGKWSFEKGLGFITRFDQTFHSKIFKDSGPQYNWNVRIVEFRTSIGSIYVEIVQDLPGSDEGPTGRVQFGIDFYRSKD